MKKTAKLLCATLMLTVYGCGTIQGLGKDLSVVGDWIIKGSGKIKEALSRENDKADKNIPLE